MGDGRGQERLAQSQFKPDSQSSRQTECAVKDWRQQSRKSARQARTRFWKRNQKTVQQPGSKFALSRGRGTSQFAFPSPLTGALHCCRDDQVSSASSVSVPLAFEGPLRSRP